MFKKSLLTLTVFAIALTFGASQVSAASDIKVEWSGLKNGYPTLSGYIGTVAETTIKVKNTSSVNKNIEIGKGAFTCDYGEVAKPCSNNRNNQKSGTEKLTLKPKESITRTLSQNTPREDCGTAQVDFHVKDLTDGSTQGAFWGFAYTGSDCDDGYAPCPTPGAALNAPGKRWDGKTPDVSHPTGTHWIAGQPKLREGADYVYFIGADEDRKAKVLQCFYPKETNKPNIQTNWRKIGANNPITSKPGYVYVANGADFNLLPKAYFAQNSNF